MNRAAVVVGGALAGSIAASAAAQSTAMRFVECSAEVGATHFFDPAAGFPGQHTFMTGGLCVADFDADGWPDIYANGGGDGTDKLFMNEQGVFVDRAPAWGMALTTRSVASCAGDVNKDGLVDLFVVGYGDAPALPTLDGCKLYLNRGGFFEDVAGEAGVRRIASTRDGLGATFGDIDNDGDLDLFACSWIFADGGNRLFINEGWGEDGVPRFTDATAVMGVVTGRLPGFTPRMIDMNGDRLPELILTNDFGLSKFFVNLGRGEDGYPRFADVTDAAGVVNDTNGMGATFGDIDHDGDLDWFITNIYSGDSGYTNTLYMNTGLDPRINAPVFRQSAADAGVGDAGWGWGTVFGDFDLDGDLDLAATGGWPFYPPTPARMYEQWGSFDGLPRFTDVAQASGFHFTGLGRTLVSLDFDRDGDLDLAMSSASSAMRLYRNTTPRNGNGGLVLDLRTTPHPCMVDDGRHARIEVDAGGVTRTAVLDGGPTYLGQSEMIVHVGIGPAETADEVRVFWADGTRTTRRHVEANTRLTIEARHPADVVRDGAVNASDVVAFVDAFTTTGLPDVNGDGARDANDVIDFVRSYNDPCPR